MVLSLANEDKLASQRKVGKRENDDEDEDWAAVFILTCGPATRLTKRALSSLMTLPG